VSEDTAKILTSVATLYKGGYLDKSQLANIDEILGLPVRAMADGTQQLPEYAQNLLEGIAVFTPPTAAAPFKPKSKITVWYESD
jgi:hypothetical protein